MLEAWVDWLATQLSGGENPTGTLLLVTGVVAGLAVFCLFLALRQFIGVYSQTADRLEDIVAMDEAEAAEVASRRKRPGFLSRLVMRLSVAPGIAQDLDRADLALSVPEYVLMMAVAAALGFVFGLLRGSLVLGLLLAMTALMVLRMWVSRRARLRRRAFARQLNDIINLVVGALRAGYGPVQALTIVTREMPAPASREMGRVVREVQLGLSLPRALDNSAERLDNDDWGLVVTSIKIQSEVGGNLAEILDTVGHTIRERVRILGEIRVLTTQQRLTGWLLTLLPVGLAVILYVINPEYMSGLLEPGLPLMLAIMGVVGIVLGAIVIRRIVAIDV
ncbi:MAG: secretion system protein F [Anaerolineae bacterium]|nr:secretion system protein F [Anaerolineae bacterium]